MIEGLFVFSLIWSIGATTETAGRTLMNLFLRKLLKKMVEEAPDRAEFDLGPGITIQPPEFDLRPVLPVVSPQIQFGTAKILRDRLVLADP